MLSKGTVLISSFSIVLYLWILKEDITDKTPFFWALYKLFFTFLQVHILNVNSLSHLEGFLRRFPDITEALFCLFVDMIFQLPQPHQIYHFLTGNTSFFQSLDAGRGHKNPQKMFISTKETSPTIVSINKRPDLNVSCDM